METVSRSFPDGSRYDIEPSDMGGVLVTFHVLGEGGRFVEEHFELPGVRHGLRFALDLLNAISGDVCP